MIKGQENTGSSVDSVVKLGKVQLREDIDFLALQNLNKYKEAVRLADEYSNLAGKARNNIRNFQEKLFDTYKFNRQELQQYIPEKDFPIYIKNLKHIRYDRENIKTWDDYFLYTGDILIERFTVAEQYNQGLFGYAYFREEDRKLKQYFVDHINKCLYVIGLGVDEKIIFDKEKNRLILELSYTYVWNEKPNAWSKTETRSQKHNVGTVTICLTSNRIMNFKELEDEKS